MEITQATPEDISGILPLQSQIYRIEKLPKNAAIILLSLINANYCDVLVAKKNGKIIGAGTIFYLNNPAHGTSFGFLEGIVVDDKFRGKGVGTALCKKAIELAKKNECYKIIFTSGMDREKIHKFYENLGFKKWGYEFRMDLD